MGNDFYFLPAGSCIATRPKPPETVPCTICCAEGSSGFYPGCLIADGHGDANMSCDGRGNVTIRHYEHPGIDELIERQSAKPLLRDPFRDGAFT